MSVVWHGYLGVLVWVCKFDAFWEELGWHLGSRKVVTSGIVQSFSIHHTYRGGRRLVRCSRMPLQYYDSRLRYSPTLSHVDAKIILSLCWLQSEIVAASQVSKHRRRVYLPTVAATLAGNCT